MVDVGLETPTPLDRPSRQISPTSTASSSRSTCGELEVLLLRQSSGSQASRRSPVEQVGHADAAPGHLVFVGRSDAASGGADLARPRAASPPAPCRAPGASRGSRVRAPKPAPARGRASTPRACSASSSPSRISGSTTTPGPIRFTCPDRGRPRAPRGERSARRRLPGCGPALLPPWKRTTRSARWSQPIDELPLALVAPLGPDRDECGHSIPGPAAGWTINSGIWRRGARRRSAGAVPGPRSPASPPRRSSRISASCMREMLTPASPSMVPTLAPPHRARSSLWMKQRRTLRNRLEHEVVDADDARLGPFEDGAHDQTVVAARPPAW